MATLLHRHIVAINQSMQKAAAREAENEWYGFDLDGTLAEYKGWRGPGHIGKPIEAVVTKVKGLLEDGKTVKIFTARASGDNGNVGRRAVTAWCKEHLGQSLPITCKKDRHCKMLFDDRATSVKKNKGIMKAAAQSDWGWMFAGLPGDVADKVLKLTESIDEDDLYTDGSGDYGKELEPHITLLYGIDEEDGDLVKEKMGPTPTGAVSFGGLSTFDNPKYQVLKLDIKGKVLQEVHDQAMDKVGAPGNTHPEYHPHTTIAYLKPGVDVSKYAIGDLKGVSFGLPVPVFENRAREETVMDENQKEATATKATMPIGMLAGLALAASMPKSDLDAYLRAGLHGAASGSQAGAAVDKVIHPEDEAEIEKRKAKQRRLLASTYAATQDPLQLASTLKLARKLTTKGGSH